MPGCAAVALTRVRGSAVLSGGLILARWGLAGVAGSAVATAAGGVAEVLLLLVLLLMLIMEERRKGLTWFAEEWDCCKGQVRGREEAYGAMFSAQKTTSEPEQAGLSTSCSMPAVTPGLTVLLPSTKK